MRKIKTFVSCNVIIAMNDTLLASIFFLSLYLTKKVIIKVRKKITKTMKNYSRNEK